VVELEFYGLLDRALPYHAQDLIGQALLKRACLSPYEFATAKKLELQTAVAQARALVVGRDKSSLIQLTLSLKVPGFNP
jgi:hypothetical protein